MFRFFRDLEKQKRKIAIEGGMRIKYSTLVNYMLSGHQNCKVHQESADSILVGAVSYGGQTSFELIQTFGSITITWRSESPLFGKHKLEWQFPEYTNQEKIINQINSELEDYFADNLQMNI
ncbi:MAG: hypothetical protein CMP66_04410 [Flavobacteriales bacterium]|nr:hypothetical protein [Flavobacteriales bacterium]|tara:strand:+ start:12584 stop:12946 length:363 start_codon:yes stop_codon:yes gene_type:complete